jgi:hypothetical protein
LEAKNSMGGGGKPYGHALVTEQIRRLVAEAVEKRETLSTAEVVAKVRALYPMAGISKRALANEVIAAAAAAGVAVEFGSVKKREAKRRRGTPSEAC